jgi:hypothetical protein
MEVTMMEGREKGAKALAVLSLSVALMTVGTSGPARAHDDGRASVIPIDAVAYGSTYGEWGARYWQWVLSIPAATNPGSDTTGEFCREGQQGPVWFLGSTFTSDPVTRHCTVPAGKALFFPIATVISGAGAYDCDPTVPDVPCNIAALRVIAGDATDPVSLEVTIDGKRLRNLRGQRVQTPVFTLTYPEGNVFEAPPGTLGPNVADGYWLMLAPLSVGKHTIRSRAVFTGGFFEGNVIEATTYLTVVPY